MEVSIYKHSFLPWVVLHTALGPPLVRQDREEEVFCYGHAWIIILHDSDDLYRKSQHDAILFVQHWNALLPEDQRRLHILDGTNAKEIPDYCWNGLECGRSF